MAAFGQYIGVEPSLRDRLRTVGPDAFAALGDGHEQAVYRCPPG